MAIKFLSDLDLGGSQITDFALENRTSNPTSPSAGQVYYHTTDDEVKIYNGSSWDVVGLTYTAGNGVSLSGTAFTVAGGDGLTQEASGLKVDNTVVRTSGAQSVGGNKTFSNNVIITGNLTVNGTNTILNTAELAVEDTNITLNTGADSGANSGISVNRGNEAYVPVLQWDESAQRWSFSNNGSDFDNIPTGVADGANAYSLPTASASTKGGVKIGSGITITSGVISADSQTANDFTTALKTKLDGIAASADAYGSWTASDGTTSETIGSGTQVNFEGENATSVTYDATNNTFTISSDDTNTTYTVGDGGLTQNNFTNDDHTKLNGIETSATADQTAAELKAAIGTGNGKLVPAAGTAGHFLKHDGTFGAPSYTTNTNTQLSDDYVIGLFSGGSNITLASDGTIAGTANTQLSDEQVQDIVGAMVSSNTETNISVTYNDTTAKLNFVADNDNTTYSAGVGVTLTGTSFSSDTSSYKQSFTAVESISVAQTSHRCAFPASISLFDSDGNMVLAEVAMNASTGAVTVSGLPNANYHISIVGTRG